MTFRTGPDNQVTLYAVWCTAPAPTDINVAYHNDSDSVTVSGKADDLDDPYGIVTVCANDSSADACTPSDIRVSSVVADPNDPGRLSIRATANLLKSAKTWAGALVCPAGTPFPTFQDGQPVNENCSNIEILTNGRSSGWTGSDGFSVGGRFSCPGNSNYTTVDSDFKKINGSYAGSYDVWMFTRSQDFNAMGVPLRVLSGYQYPATQTLSDSDSGSAAASRTQALLSDSARFGAGTDARRLEAESRSAAQDAGEAGAQQTVTSSSSTNQSNVPAVTMRSGPIVVASPRTQSLRIQGSGSGQQWNLPYPAAEFSSWYQRDAPYYIAARLTLDSGGFTTQATSETTRSSAVLPWLEVKFDVNADNGGVGTAPDPVYGFTDGGRSMVTLPGKDGISGATGRLTGWSATPGHRRQAFMQREGRRYRLPQEHLPATTVLLSRSMPYGTFCPSLTT